MKARVRHNGAYRLELGGDTSRSDCCVNSLSHKSGKWPLSDCGAP